MCAALVASAVKYFPNFDPRVDYYNFIFDWVLSFILIFIPFYLIYKIRIFNDRWHIVNFENKKSPD